MVKNVNLIDDIVVCENCERRFPCSNKYVKCKYSNCICSDCVNSMIRNLKVDTVIFPIQKYFVDTALKCPVISEKKKSLLRKHLVLRELSSASTVCLFNET